MSCPRRALSLGAAALCTAASGTAAETSAPFAVTAAVVNGCAVAVMDGGAWGRIDFGIHAGSADGTVEAELMSGAGAGLAVECTPGTAVSVTAGPGQHALSGQRRMARGAGAGGAAIPYTLFAGGGAVPWTTQAVALAFSEGQGSARLPIRGRAVIAGNPAAGTYTDTVRITLSW